MGTIPFFRIEPAGQANSRIEVAMKAIIKNLNTLNNDELQTLTEAIDLELERRQGRTEEIPESARRRAVLRDQSYRRSTGSTAPPVRVTGLKGQRKRRHAA
jgi:hypothetical protein